MLTTNVGYHTIITDLEYNGEIGALEAVTRIWWQGEYIRVVARGDARYMDHQHRSQAEHIEWLDTWEVA